MITAVDCERLLVVSDIHLGNRLFHARSPFIEFLRFTGEMRADLCVNGDGVDISQLSLRKLTGDISAVSSYLRRLSELNLRVYYVVGNHDIVLENFLDDWGVINVVPFLNVTSGDKRIHIEHGHLFDHSFVQFPRFYQWSTYLGRLCLKIHPSVYHALTKLKPCGEMIRRAFMPSVIEHDKSLQRIDNEPVGFCEAAVEIARHGFDYVILGHTHCQGCVTLDNGTVYMNTGSWLLDPHFVQIENGRVLLRRVASRELNLMEGSWRDFSANERARTRHAGRRASIKKLRLGKEQRRS